MILFWLICALFVVIALAFVLPPLLQTEIEDIDSSRRQANIAVYRDQISELEADLRNGVISEEQFQQERDELERRLLDDVSGPTDSQPKTTKQPVAARNWVYALAFGIPLVAVPFYLQIGDRQAIARVPVAARPTAAPPEMGGQRSQQQIEASVASLAKRLEQNPNDFDGWIMLANSYTSLERYSDAGNAYEKAVALKPNDADLLAEYAFVLAMGNDRKLEGRPTELIERALKIDPENPKALQLGGGAAYEAKNYDLAIKYWEKLLGKVPAESDLGQMVSQRIADAKAQAQK
jgi:cytochrome c-type biogenesis protein CcmH